VTSELERHAAACIFASFRGHEPPEWVLRWLDRGLGGLVLFADNIGDPEQLAGLTAALRAQRPDLIVAIDEEGGDVTRLEAATGSSYPGNLALGVVDDTSLTARVAEAIAHDLANVGVTMNFAPVADVNTNPRNPVIGVRSFGSDPALVARHVAAYVNGTQRAGVAACAKHFPGHGDTHSDSHLELPIVDADREALDAAALVPFRAAIEAGVRAVMTAHILVPRIDSSPATISRVLMTDLLRNELGFEGLVVSDALEMRAIASGVGVEEGAVRALDAGVDALCLGHEVDDTLVAGIHRVLVESVAAGRLGAGRLAKAAQAVAEAVPSAALDDHVPDDRVGAAAARDAARAVGNVSLRSPPLIVELVPEPTIAAGLMAHSLGAEIAGRWTEADVIQLHEPPADAAEVVRGARNRPLVVVLRDALRHEWQQSAASELVALRPDAVIVEIGLPGWMPDSTGAFIETYGAGRVNLEAAADLLCRFGKTSCGHRPVLG
jgi:beta-N-acetylhexosaminidase